MNANRPHPLYAWPEEPDYPREALPYRKALHQQINFAAECRQSGDLGIARRILARMHGYQHDAAYWQKIP
jgi:hypothetical protein